MKNNRALIVPSLIIGFIGGVLFSKPKNASKVSTPNEMTVLKVKYDEPEYAYHDEIDFQFIIVAILTVLVFALLITFLVVIHGDTAKEQAQKDIAYIANSAEVYHSITDGTYPASERELRQFIGDADMGEILDNGDINYVAIPKTDGNFNYCVESTTGLYSWHVNSWSYHADELEDGLCDQL